MFTSLDLSTVPCIRKVVKIFVVLLAQQRCFVSDLIAFDVRLGFVIHCMYRIESPVNVRTWSTGDE